MQLEFYNARLHVHDAVAPLEGIVLVADTVEQADDIFFAFLGRATEPRGLPSTFRFSKRNSQWSLYVVAEHSLGRFQAEISGMTDPMVGRLKAALCGNQQFLPVLFGYREPELGIAGPQDRLYFKGDLYFGDEYVVGRAKDRIEYVGLATRIETIELGHP